jgi:glycosyltransferase involved in cell wall biosynthesis
VPGIEIIVPVALPSVSNVWDLVNRHVFLPRLCSRIKDLISSRPIVLNYLPTQSAIDLCRMLRPKIVVYDYVDHWIGDPRTPLTVKDTHHVMLELADLVTTPSPFLAAEARSNCKTPVAVVPHGVDFELFNVLDPGRSPDRIHKVGYFGGIGPYIDFAFLGEIAQALQLLMIGPARVPLPAWENLTWHPLVPQRELVEKIASCDAFVIPYKSDDYGSGINPIKLLEYFATGRPVVGTAIPALVPYEDIMIVAQDGKQAVQCLTTIDDWDDENRRQSRLALARQRRWQSAVSQMIEQISLVMR